MLHTVISVLGLDGTLQTSLTSFDKKVNLNARHDVLGVRRLSNPTAVTAVNSVGDNLVSQLAMENSL